MLLSRVMVLFHKDKWKKKKMKKEEEEKVKRGKETLSIT